MAWVAALAWVQSLVWGFSYAMGAGGRKKRNQGVRIIAVHPLTHVSECDQRALVLKYNCGQSLRCFQG